MPYLLAVSSASDALSEFTSLFSTAWTFLTSNWYFTVLIAVPLGGLIISIVMGVIRSNR
ncbi:MAG: hypothetical protein J1E81_05150 [Eubacterium sp.]|nr:hypothetical protein [Eubacterium sp.]